LRIILVPLPSLGNVNALSYGTTLLATSFMATLIPVSACQQVSEFRLRTAD